MFFWTFLPSSSYYSILGISVTQFRLFSHIECKKSTKFKIETNKSLTIVTFKVDNLYVG
jgi:hypothetical protein